MYSLYTTAVLSPICLLGPYKLSKSGKGSIALVDLVEVRITQRENTDATEDRLSCYALIECQMILT